MEEHPQQNKQSRYRAQCVTQKLNDREREEDRQKDKRRANEHNEL